MHRMFLSTCDHVLIRDGHCRGGIQVVDEIPKSPTGKVLRRVLVEKFEGGEKAKL